MSFRALSSPFYFIDRDRWCVYYAAGGLLACSAGYETLPDHSCRCVVDAPNHEIINGVGFELNVLRLLSNFLCQ